jgi:hypothetical protein
MHQHLHTGETFHGAHIAVVSNIVLRFATCSPAATTHTQATLELQGL